MSSRKEMLAVSILWESSSLLVGEQDGDLVAHEGLPQPVGSDAQQGLAVGVREEALRELCQRDQVAAFGLQQFEAPP